MKSFTLIFLSALIGSVSDAAVYRFIPSKGRVSFLAKGKPALISINGIGEGVSGDLNEEKSGHLSGDISFDLKQLKTGIDLRDQHMQNKYLEVDKYPKALLKIVNLELPKSGVKFVFEGILSLHGVAQTVKGEATFKTDGAVKSILAEFPIKLSQFKIDIPSFKGITVAEDVLVKIETPVIQSEQ